MKMEQIAEILNRINDALEGTGFQVVGYDNTGSTLEIMIDEEGSKQ